VCRRPYSVKSVYKQPDQPLITVTARFQKIPLLTKAGFYLKGIALSMHISRAYFVASAVHVAPATNISFPVRSNLWSPFKSSRHLFTVLSVFSCPRPFSHFTLIFFPQNPALLPNPQFLAIQIHDARFTRASTALSAVRRWLYRFVRTESLRNELAFPDRRQTCLD
jgi:hypothetical protein